MCRSRSVKRRKKISSVGSVTLVKKMSLHGRQGELSSAPSRQLWKKGHRSRKVIWNWWSLDQYQNAMMSTSLTNRRSRPLARRTLKWPTAMHLSSQDWVRWKSGTELCLLVKGIPLVLGEARQLNRIASMNNKFTELIRICSNYLLRKSGKTRFPLLLVRGNRLD